MKHQVKQHWPAESIWETVVPLLPGFSVEVVPEIDSTNSELMRRARAARLDPVLLVAEQQSAGRGRLGRSWSSVAGDTLTFSLGLPMQSRNLSGLSLVVGLCVVQSLHPALLLKWPNDVWYEGRKLAGILVETASVGEACYVVIGIGVNIHVHQSDGLRTPMAVLSELLPEADAATTLLKLALPLVQAVQRFEREGFAAFMDAYSRRDALLGQQIQCSDGLVGIGGGVSNLGELLVQTDSGLVKINSAEVSVRPFGQTTP